MGEVRTRRLVASSLVMLLVLLVPVSAEEGDSVELEIDVVDANAKQWYGAGDVVLLDTSILNNGGATSITEDPSCGTVMIVTNAEGENVIDERSACRGQSRGLDINAGTTPLQQHQWDLTNQEGERVSPGCTPSPSNLLDQDCQRVRPSWFNKTLVFQVNWSSQPHCPIVVMSYPSESQWSLPINCTILLRIRLYLTQ